ncbi:MAG TPA: hypothetical protein VFL10_02815 [Ornithinibacter sp.]|nr:hypothetical protein [Ornithinibacter sp.]
MKRQPPATTPTGLALRWVPVTGADGRVRMEMRWTAPQVVTRRIA